MVAGPFKIQAANLSRFLKGSAAAQKQAHSNLTFTENAALSTAQDSLFSTHLPRMLANLKDVKIH